MMPLMDELKLDYPHTFALSLYHVKDCSVEKKNNRTVPFIKKASKASVPFESR